MKCSSLRSFVFALCVGLAGVASGDSDRAVPRSTATLPSAAGAHVPEQLRVRVIRALPHDRTAFTQGLLIHAGALYESTGMKGRSTLRHVEPESGKVLRRIDLDPAFFGEGLARVGDRLVQLTWTSRKAFVYDMLSFRKVGELAYDGEGWGLCFDGDHLVMSDGSDRLTVRDPETFAVLREIPVTLSRKPQKHLNELECVDGAVYANVWTTEKIVRIDPRDGRVTAEIDAGGLLTPEEDRGTDVLNGIAYDKRTGHFFITGKYWPKMFEVEFVPADAAGRAPS